MAAKVTTISDLIHRVACSCITHHHPVACLGLHHRHAADSDPDDDGEEEATSSTEEEADDSRDQQTTTTTTAEGEEEDSSERSPPANAWAHQKAAAALERVREVESLMSEAFDAVSAVKRAYVGLQEAHRPWDPARMRAADAAVVAELRRLGRLRDRFRRGGAGGGSVPAAAAPMREVVAPYEAALEDLRREVKTKDAEIENLEAKLRCSATAPPPRRSRKKGRSNIGASGGLGTTPMAAPSPELFEACMDEVKSASKSFTSHLLSLMRAARWDIAAAARSIVEHSSSLPESDDAAGRHLTIPATADARHAKHALESYVVRKMFVGFENETFYLDGSLTSLLRPGEFRLGCFTQFRDMRAMDPAEILGILPGCSFGKFAAKKYLAILHLKMESSLFGGTEQRRAVEAGAHPRTGFYGDFLRLAKAVWMLHLVAFALDPPPSHFEVGKRADFQAEYMESVVMFPGGRVPGGAVVGFSVGPGFRLGNGSVVRARVYLVPGP